jgi:hypothetical protein
LRSRAADLLVSATGEQVSHREKCLHAPTATQSFSTSSSHPKSDMIAINWAVGAFIYIEPVSANMNPVSAIKIRILKIGDQRLARKIRG